MIDDDIDAPEDFEKEHVEKPSLRDIWENNPALKLVAIVLGGAILLGGYMIFFSKGDETAKSVIHMKEAATAKQVPGKDAVDAEYRKALEQENKKTAEEAAKHGGSAIGLPIAVANNTGLNIPEMPEKPKSDVLDEWKRVADAGRMKAAKDAIDEENAAPAPDVVPLVQPIRPQQAVKANPDLAKEMAAQMRVIIAAQAPPKPSLLTITKEDSPYEVQKKADEAKAAQAKLASNAGANGGKYSGTGAGSASSGSSTKNIVPAGSIAYAQLLNELDSDINGPVLAQILSGPFAGGRIIGKVSMNTNCSCDIINFSTIVKDTVSYKVDAVALDENTTLAGQATEVDNHYFDRYVVPAAAAFLNGYATALSTPAQSQNTTAGVGVETTQSQSTISQSLYKGLATGTGALSNDMTALSNTPITVIIAKGTTMGVFFTSSVTTKDAMQ